jgi:hypothetical protein
VLHWTEPFLSRLSATTKLVGSTISCEGSPLGGDMNGTWRRNPHVQSYAVATDRVSSGGDRVQAAGAGAWVGAMLRIACADWVCGATAGRCQGDWVAMLVGCY